MQKTLSLLSLLFIATTSLVFSKQKTLPLADVKIGDEGHWKTVIKGTELESFPMKVLGVSENFVGPQRHVIICEALDKANILSGPVSGMSGSPVYINGKLIGAYAYGYLWPKQQSIFGVTPIDQMFEVLEQLPAKERRPSSKQLSTGKIGKEQKDFSLVFDGVSYPISGSMVPTTLSTSGLSSSQSTFAVSGFSNKTLAAFGGEMKMRGFNFSPMAGSGSHRKTVTKKSNQKYKLDAGYPVAGVLLGGDFSMAGTGTITWRDGNKLLAFGHPFFGSGPVEIPMAGGETITIVRNLQSSFKMSKFGPIVGSIYQDRLTAIAGEIGRVAPTTHLQFNIKAPNGVSKTYQGDLFEHKDYSPWISAMALVESLFSSMENEDEQTLYLTRKFKVKGHDVIETSTVGGDRQGIMNQVYDFMFLYHSVLNNPFEFPRVEYVDFDLRLENEIRVSNVLAINMNSKTVKAGGTTDFTLTLENHLKEKTELPLSIPFPETLKGEDVQIIIADAGTMDTLDKGSNRYDLKNLKDILQQATNKRSAKNIYVKVTRKSPGLRIQGETLNSLPPSLISLYSSPRNIQAYHEIDHETIWEAIIPVEGEFRGSITLLAYVE